jgi:hypothetical protein
VTPLNGSDYRRAWEKYTRIPASVKPPSSKYFGGVL